MQLQVLQLTASALALAVVAAAEQGQTRCYTAMVSKRPAHVTTRWIDVTDTDTHCTQTRTITHTFSPTVTLSATTEITVTASATTGTVTSTTIATSTAVTTVTATGSTSTIAASTSTPTVPASQGFTPVQAGVPGASYSPSGAASSSGGAAASSSVSVAPRGYRAPQEVPGDVTCYRSTCECETQTKIQTRTAPTTVTHTSTVSVVTTPGATVTSIVSAQSTVNSTVTVTSIPTATITPVAATPYYAACATGNFANLFNEQIINGCAYAGQPTGTNATTPYECCVQAIAAPQSAGAALWYFGSGNCYIDFIGGSNCPNGQASDGSGNEFSTGNSPTEYYPPLIVGNAYCGYWGTGTVVK